MTLKEELKQKLNIPEDDFSNHCSDLYLLWTKESEQYLRSNYEYWSNVEIYTSNVKGQEWFGKRFFDIPFAYTEYHTKSIIH